MENQITTNDYDYKAAWQRELERYNSVIDAFPGFIKEASDNMDDDDVAMLMELIQKHFDGCDINVSRPVAFTAVISVRVEATVDVPFGRNPEDFIADALTEEVDADNLVAGHEISVDYTSHEIDYIDADD